MAGELKCNTVFDYIRPVWRVGQSVTLPTGTFKVMGRQWHWRWGWTFTLIQGGPYSWLVDSRGYKV